MRIDWLELRNFKKFREESLRFPRRADAAPDAGSFHVLIGENGVGKTSILDALAVALGVWLERKPDSLLENSHRRITKDQKRLLGTKLGDRWQLQQAQETTSVRVRGDILDQRSVTWGQALPIGRSKVSNELSKAVLARIWDAYQSIGTGEKVLLPVVCYYGAGRAWLPHNERQKAKAKSNGPANRWEAFYDCLNERIRFADLAHWFQVEQLAKGAGDGQYRPGFEVVRRAILACVPDADGVSYDGDFKEIVLSINGNAQPLSNLSAGQRVMLTLVADLAIRIVTQNNFLVPADKLTADDEPLPRVLAQTPGVVLIDELDVHLHPTWQRRAAVDLQRIFPKIQFVTTTHSPQVIGGVHPEEIIRLLPAGGHDVPAQSYGMDTNWILQVLMNADEQQPDVKHDLKHIFDLIAERKLDDAQLEVGKVREQIGNSEALQRAASTIERIRLFGK
ncbi:AAA family ATPase [Anatilimnocola sp. NA78]|uniref:AAA family ATPase n=1 Tax=Anatilimnocola sp. NA78 TaxID=3415683 RepID=UPI003CE583F3